MSARQGFKSIASLLLVLVVLGHRPVFAQDVAQAPVFKKEEIQQLLAPIALYPDQLLAQVLMASTYPLQIVQAARWQKDNAKLAGDALDKALAPKEWDASVKSIVPFPQVLQMMNDELEWTQKLGDAFLAQQADVMAEVQALRAKAQSAGTLKTTEQQKVTTQKQVIVIQPSTPQTVYVPVYNPTVVYGGWPYPTYPPYYYPPPPGSAFVAGVFWGTAIAASAHYWGWGDCDWHGGDINIDVDRYNDISIDRDKITSKEWKHNPANRGQVPYRDQKSREQFGAKASPVRASREARGFEPDRAGKPGGPTAGTMDRAKPDRRDTAKIDAPKAANRDAPKREASRPAAKEKVARAPDVAQGARKPERPAAQQRTSPSPGAFDVKRGADARAHSSRGQASRQSMARHGGGGGGSRAGGGGGRRR